jgi:post-segregation antitoxin (ccd killing protein)
MAQRNIYLSNELNQVLRDTGLNWSAIARTAWIERLAALNINLPQGVSIDG